MQKNQNNITFAIILAILILMVIGIYIYYFVTPTKVKVKSSVPPPCSPGDLYDYRTGDKCLGAPLTTSQQ